MISHYRHRRLSEKIEREQKKIASNIERFFFKFESYFTFHVLCFMFYISRFIVNNRSLETTIR